jgi:cell fate (sporulation/competence/biofilm development) regulator YmcA (YheA/YmcA/DUF963 family)
MFDEFNVLVFNMSALENAETRADRLSNEINVSATNYLTLLNDYFRALDDVLNKLIQAQVHDSAIAGRINQPNANNAEESARQAKKVVDRIDVTDKVSAFKAYHTALTQWHNTLKYIYRGDEVIIQKDLIKGQVQPLINETAMTAAESGREAAQPQVIAAQPSVKKQPLQRRKSEQNLRQDNNKANPQFVGSQDDFDLNNPNSMFASQFTIKGNNGKTQKTKKFVRFTEDSKIGGSRRRKGRKTRRR